MVVVNSDKVRAIKPHLLSRSDFFALAEGRGSKDLIDLLWRAERSRRLLLITSLVDSAERDPAVLGPLPGAGAAWRALAEAQRARPAAVDPVVMHPQVGTALSYALRRLSTAEVGDGPLWVDVGQIHTVSLVVAARAGLSWQTVVPLRDGAVMLPGLGLARFPLTLPWDTAQARTEGGRIWLDHDGHEFEVPADPSVDGGQWLGLRQLSVGVAPVLRLWLDDLDPFRDFADPVPPERLDGPTRQRWLDLLTAAWAIICADLPEVADALAAAVRSVVPLPEADGWDNRSASTGEAFGSVMLSPPSDPTALAVSLVHEFQHIKLGGLMHLLTLTRPDETATLYAPWRDDPRPLAGLTQGAYAFVGIAAFWRSHRAGLDGTHGALATFEYGLARDQTRQALRILRASPMLTPMGREFVDRMHTHVESWLDDEIPATLTDLIRLVAQGHRAGWRIRHLRPDLNQVSTMARAWLEGAPPPPWPDGVVVAHQDRNWSRGRLGLARRRIVAPDRLGAARITAPWAANLTTHDLALVSGRFDAARDGYLAGIRADPVDLDAWTGLGLALRGTAETAASTVLLCRPEVVLAVHTLVRAQDQAPSPVALAAWLGFRAQELVD